MLPIAKLIKDDAKEEVVEAKIDYLSMIKQNKINLEKKRIEEEKKKIEEEKIAKNKEYDHLIWMYELFMNELYKQLEIKIKNHQQSIIDGNEVNEFFIYTFSQTEIEDYFYILECHNAYRNQSLDEYLTNRYLFAIDFYKLGTDDSVNRKLKEFLKKKNYEFNYNNSTVIVDRKHINISFENTIQVKSNAFLYLYIQIKHDNPYDHN